MDIYLYNSDFQQLEVMDQYESLIWTERYSILGEMELLAPDTFDNRLFLKEENFVQIPESKEAVQISTFNAKDGLITVKGKMLTGFLAQRFAKRSWNNSQSYIPFSGNPISIMFQLVRNFAMLTTGYMGTGQVTNATDGPYEIIPNLQLATSILDHPELLDLDVDLQIPQGDLYTALKYVADLFALSFRLYPANITQTSYDLIFEIYEGKDRTSAQTRNTVVSFHSALERLINTEEVRSIETYKNVAYAYATGIPTTDPYVGVAYANAAARYYRGFKRRTLFVDVSDIQTDDVDLTTLAGRTAFQNLMNRQAKNALINNNYVRMIDGTIVDQKDCEYGVHYNLGDIIELVSDNGITSTARVTEYIRSVDAEGYSAYPTLSSDSEEA